MTIYSIPVQQTTDAFVEQVSLDGVVYDLSFRWNARDAHWFLTIAENNISLLDGLKLVCSDDLLRQFRRISNLPPGRLFVRDLDGRFRDPDDILFGDRVLLLYEAADG